MKFISLIVLTLMLTDCSDHQNNHFIDDKKNNLLDTIRNESLGARLLFFRDFATSKISLLIKEAKDKKNIDTLLSFIGNEKKDTSCYLFTDQNPIGEIYFYKDTSMSEELADVYFTLDGKCNGWYAGINRNSQKFDLTPTGKLYLSETKNKIEKYWKK